MRRAPSPRLPTPPPRPSLVPNAPMLGNDTAPSANSSSVSLFARTRSDQALLPPGRSSAFERTRSAGTEIAPPIAPPPAPAPLSRGGDVTHVGPDGTVYDLASSLDQSSPSSKATTLTRVTPDIMGLPLGPGAQSEPVHQSAEILGLAAPQPHTPPPPPPPPPAVAVLAAGTAVLLPTSQAFPPPKLAATSSQATSPPKLPLSPPVPPPPPSTFVASEGASHASTGHAPPRPPPPTVGPKKVSSSNDKNVAENAVPAQTGTRAAKPGIVHGDKSHAVTASHAPPPVAAKTAHAGLGKADGTHVATAAPASGHPDKPASTHAQTHAHAHGPPPARPPPPALAAIISQIPPPPSTAAAKGEAGSAVTGQTGAHPVVESSHTHMGGQPGKRPPPTLPPRPDAVRLRANTTDSVTRAAPEASAASPASSTAPSMNTPPPADGTPGGADLNDTSVVIRRTATSAQGSRPARPAPISPLFSMLQQPIIAIPKPPPPVAPRPSRSHEALNAATLTARTAANESVPGTAAATGKQIDTTASSSLPPPPNAGSSDSSAAAAGTTINAMPFEAGAQKSALDLSWLPPGPPTEGMSPRLSAMDDAQLPLPPPPPPEQDPASLESAAMALLTSDLPRPPSFLLAQAMPNASASADTLPPVPESPSSSPPPLPPPPPPPAPAPAPPASTGPDNCGSLLPRALSLGASIASDLAGTPPPLPPPPTSTPPRAFSVGQSSSSGLAPPPPPPPPLPALLFSPAVGALGPPPPPPLPTSLSSASVLSAPPPVPQRDPDAVFVPAGLGSDL
jgi:hypothetical protein